MQIPSKKVSTSARTGFLALALLATISFLAFAPPAAADCPVNRPNCPPNSGGVDSPFPKPLGPTFPHYYLVTILYVPPGNDSEVKYGAGSTTGTKSEMTSSFKAGTKIEFETRFGAGVSGSASTEFGLKGGHTFEVKKEVTSTLNLKSSSDFMNHAKDTFYLWMNPQVDVTQTAVDSFSLSWHTRDGDQQMLVVPVNVEELLGRAPIPDFKRVQLAPLTERDRQSILAMDPFVPALNFPLNAPPAHLDPKRFVRIDEKQLDGPDNPGDPAVGTGEEVSDESATGMISGVVSSASTEVLFGGGFDLGPFENKLQAGFVFDYDYENTTEETQGTTQKFEVDLRSTTVGFHEVVDIFEDTASKSFAFVSVGRFPPGSEIVRGTVTDASGRPLASQRVIVHLPDGAQRTVFTDGRGVYRVFSAVLGTAQVRVGSEVQTFNVQPGTTKQVNLHITGNANFR
jgi:hypothetical protein